MRSFRSDPYLWVHLAGVAAVPIFLELCLLGLGIGRSLMPVWFELVFVGGLGIAPILWMQWQKPFCIFSLLLFALRPDQLSEDQRKLLKLFKSPVNQFLSVGVAVLMAGVLWRFYQAAPLANGLIFPSAARGTGLLIAAIAFFFANLFLQVPASVLRVLLVGENIFAATEPYPVEQIPGAFTLLGFRVKKILPALIPKPSKPVVVRPVDVTVPKETQQVKEEIQPELQGVATEIAAVEEAIVPETQPVDGTMADRTPAVEEAIEAVFPELPLKDEIFEEASIEEELYAAVEATEAPVLEAETTLEEDEIFEEAPIGEQLDAAVEATEAPVLDAETTLEELGEKEEAIAAVIEEPIEEPEILLAEGTFEEAIVPQLEEDWGDDEDLDNL